MTTRAKAKMTREEFIAHVEAQIKDKPFPWHPVPCNCTYRNCEGWRVAFGPADG